jgi:hypothetical protein
VRSDRDWIEFGQHGDAAENALTEDSCNLRESEKAEIATTGAKDNGDHC